MTIIASRRPAPAAASFPRAALGLLLTVVAGGVLAWIALATADGAVQLDENNFETEFVDGGWWSASLLLVVPVFLLARSWGFLGAAATVFLGVIQFVVAGATVHRYQVSGWSDGLEGFAYLEAAAMVVAFGLAALVGGLVGHAQRKRARGLRG
jgi:hypothetical protein